MSADSNVQSCGARGCAADAQDMRTTGVDDASRAAKRGGDDAGVGGERHTDSCSK